MQRRTKMNANNITKPITLVREEFITNMVDLCNNSGLPFFIVEDVLKSLLQEIHIAARQQLEADTKAYSQQIDKKK